MPFPTWRVRYSDRSVYDDLIGSWEDGRPNTIVCVTTIDPSGVWGRFVIYKHEFYYKIPGHEVMVSDDRALIEAHVPGILDSQIKVGGNAWQEDFQAILYAATRDPDFPIHSPRRRATDWLGDARAPV